MIIKKEEDAFNRAIMNHVWHHPDATVTQIGQAIGLKREATQKRITKLSSAGKLRRRLVVNLDALGFDKRFRIGVKISPTVLRKANKRIRKIKKEAPGITNDQILLALQLMELSTETLFVEDVAVVLGSKDDLSLTVRAQDLSQMLDFVTAVLRPIDGIVETTTCFESWDVSRDPLALKYLDSVARQRGSDARRKRRNVPRPRSAARNLTKQANR
jgi:DNA-binding Lrp family transcriptional regulator